MSTRVTTCFILFLAMFSAGCGHTLVSKVGLLSVGELQGKQIPAAIDGPIVQGEDCGGAFGSPYFLSKAVRAALKGTQHDTIVDAEITSTTGLYVGSNCVAVKGKAISSGTLTTVGGVR